MEPLDYVTAITTVFTNNNCHFLLFTLLQSKLTNSFKCTSIYLYLQVNIFNLYLQFVQQVNHIGLQGITYQRFTGMPNLRKNPFSTRFYHLFRSTDKKMIYGRIYRFFLTRFGYYPPPPTPFFASVE